ncbi:MAG: hypothetical protein ACFB15_14705 [Cyclobacteriaceae bacterium]
MAIRADFHSALPVPYGWIKEGQQAGVLSQRSTRLNVLDLLGSMTNYLAIPVQEV